MLEVTDQFAPLTRRAERTHKYGFLTAYLQRPGQSVAIGVLYSS